MVASSSVHAAGLPIAKRRTTCRTRLRNIVANSAAPIQSAQRARRVARLFDGVDALKQASRPLLRVLGLEVRRLHRSEEHTSELQSHSDLVCRLLLEKK